MPATPQRSAAPNQVRIIGGRWRSRILKFPSATGLRPTPDRVRETLFNWLGQDLSEWTTLDLFAGSGALSFEALSRGALRAVAVDGSIDVVKTLKRNAVLLGAEGLEPHCGNALQYLAGEARRFDVVFIDPPFGEEWMPRLWPLLPQRLCGGGWVYVEQPRPVEPPAGWFVHRHQVAGCVHYHLLRHESGIDPTDAIQPRPTT